MKKSIKKNYVYNLLYQVCVFLTPLITTPYVSRTLGAEGIGRNSYVTAIVSYFVLFGGIGVSTYGQREISYYALNKEERSKKFYEIFIMSLVTYTIALVSYVIFVELYAARDVLFWIATLQIVSSMCDITWFYYGIEEFGKVVFRNLIVKVLFIVLVFCFVRTPDDVFVFLIICVGTNILANLSMIILLKDYICVPDFHRLQPSAHFKGAIELFLPTIAVQIYVNVDKVMIGMTANAKVENGYYEQAQKIEGMCLMVAVAMGTVMIPRIGNYYANGDTSAIRNAIWRSFKFAMMASFPITVGINLIGDVFLSLFLGPEFEKSIIILNILAFSIILISLSNVTGTQFLVPTKRQKEYSVSVLCGMVVNIVFNLILIRRYFAVGAAVATLISETVVTTIQLLYVRKDFDIKTIFKISLKYIFASAVMGLLVFIVKKGIEVPDVVRLIICVMVGIVSYALLLYLLKDQLFLEIKDDLLGRIRNKK